MAVDSEEALQVLKAVVDAYLAIGSSLLRQAISVPPADAAQVELLEEREQG